jgi:mono/diheme cytochrome c family protein
MARSSIRSIAVPLIAMILASCAGSDTRSPANHDHAVASGERQFEASCAACHGVDARGNGPVAPLLTVAVPDLTHIAQRRGGEFPELEIFRIIDGQADLAAHGPRHMPVWGYEFFGDDADDEVAHRRSTEKVDQLVAYLRSVQRTD